MPAKSLAVKVERFLYLCRRRFRSEAAAEFPNFLSIVCISKNEGLYFREFIEFHRMVGVDKFYVYDNESDDGTREILEPYVKAGIVEYICWPGKAQQRIVYNHALLKYRFDTKWMAVVDLDEFIVPVADKTVADYLRRTPPYVTQVVIGWVNYGSGGHEAAPRGLVIENFKMRIADPCDKNAFQPRHVKGIINPRHVVKVRCHRHKHLGLDDVSSDPERNNFGTWPLRVNHYQSKSWEEFAKKKARGSASPVAHADNHFRVDKNQVLVRLYSREWFDRLDTNDVKDSIMDKHIAKLKNICPV